MNLTEEEKKEVVEAGLAAIKSSYDKTNGLEWWERLIWVVVAAISAGVTSLFSGCTSFESTADKTTLSGEDGTVIIEPGYISYKQEPVPPPDLTESPVIVHEVDGTSAK